MEEQSVTAAVPTAYTYPTPIYPGKTRVGWIGPGIMGAAMAGRIMAAGYSLTVYARTPSHPRVLDLASAGASLVASSAAVAQQSDVVFVMVGGPADVRSVILDRTSGVLHHLPPGGVVVDMTTSSPTLAGEIAAAGQAVTPPRWAVDAPVSGGDTGAREGRLAIFAGGDARVVQWLSPLMELMGRATHVGGPGCGQSCKLANQIAGAGAVVGLCEALTFAGRVGLDKGRFLEAVRGGAAGSGVMELFGERIVRGDLEPGGFAEYMLKDLGMGLEGFGGGEGGEGAAEAAVVLPGAALFRQLFQGMVGNGDARMGLHGVITVIQRMSGVDSAGPAGGL